MSFWDGLEDAKVFTHEFIAGDPVDYEHVMAFQMWNCIGKSRDSGFESKPVIGRALREPVGCAPE